MRFPDWLKVYGNTRYRGDCPTEGMEQVTFFSQIRKDYPDTYGVIGLHVRNEGKRTWQQVSREKAEGMTEGAPDIIIPGSPSFLCELKRLDHTKSKWQDWQIEYLEIAHGLGAFCCVALGWQAAMQAFKEWRDGTGR
jgi:hypothetical protein